MLSWRLSAVGATYAFSPGPISGASLSFVSPLDRKVSARSRHSSAQRTVAEGGDRTFKNRPEKDQSPPASHHSVASAEYVSPANADILGYAEL